MPHVLGFPTDEGCGQNILEIPTAPPKNSRGIFDLDG